MNRAVNIFCFLVIILFGSCSKQMHFEYYDEESTKRHKIFFVYNYSPSSKSELKIDQFVCSQMDSFNVEDHETFAVSFYKHSKFTNKEFLSKNPGFFTGEGFNIIEGRHSSFPEDYLWSYHKFDGLLSRKIRFKDIYHTFHTDRLICN